MSGNACPGSPKAPRSSRRRRSGAGKLGDQAQLREAVLRGPRHRRDAQRPDAGVAVDGEPLAHVVRRAAERDDVDQLVGQRRAAPPRACRRGRGPGPRARRPRSRSAARAGCRSSACASPSRRRRARGSGRIASRAPARSSVTNTLTVGAMSKPSRSRPARAAPSSSYGAELGDVLGREQRRDPAVGDLAGQRACSSGPIAAR